MDIMKTVDIRDVGLVLGTFILSIRGSMYKQENYVDKGRYVHEYILYIIHTYVIYIIILYIRSRSTMHKVGITYCISGTLCSS
jgi:hypothetical protein